MTERAPLGTRLSALIVNYNTGNFAVRCVQSIQKEWRGAGRDEADLEIVVVDNASPVDQEPWMLELEELGATVIRHTDNAGYSGGMNLAYARTSGGPKDVVAVLNPDLYFLADSIETMMAYVLANPRCGAVDPKACIDPALVFNLPRNPLPTLADYVFSVVARMHPIFSRSYSRRRLVEALPWWTSKEPVSAKMLSGCCVFLRREVVDELPYLMDEGFPLYYEDTDLFRTLTKRGYEVVHLNDARVLHHWSRSAGMIGDPSTPAMQRYAVSQRHYFDKYYGRIGLGVVALMNAIMKRWSPKRMDRPMHPITPIGDCHDPCVIELPRSCEFLLELGATPVWLLAAGIAGEGDRWECPAAAWEWLFEGEYYIRALDRNTHEFLGAWWIRKTTPGRAEPIGPDEAERVEALARGAVG